LNLSQLTTFKLGGPCRRFVDCRTSSELREAIRELSSRGDEFLLIGGGSNLLVSDDGLECTVVRYSNSVPEVRIENGTLIASGATTLDDLAKFSVENGVTGVVCCSGIPGTVGGAVVGNAGAFGEQIGDRIDSVRLIQRTGDEYLARHNELGFAYRKSRLQESGEIVAEVRLRVEKDDRQRLQNRRDEILALRAAKHPDWRVVRTAGSFFKNIEPTSRAERRQAAGWFLEQAGAKELRIGGARTFDKHANIVIAENGCTTADVVHLTRKMATLVRGKFGFDLQPEVRFIGRPVEF
jgi:UDP-N-acetylmuramate dehydrogenase